LRNRAIGVVAAGALIAGLGFTAPASADTTPRGSTTLLECTDVAARAKIKDSTKHGLDFTTRSIKAAGILHPEKWLPGDPKTDKFEPDLGGTPDFGDTDSCAGTIIDTGSPWHSAGHFIPYTPQQNHGAGLNELVKVAGAMWGRANCSPDGDADTIPDGNDGTEWTLHGKLVMRFGDGAGVPGTVQALDALGKPVQSQVYVQGGTIDGYQDLVSFSGIGIKATGEGAWFDAQTTFRPPSVNLVWAGEACSFGTDLDGDTIIGEPKGAIGGLVTVITDTNVDTDTFGNPSADPNYTNNSFIWSI
jgi:hypothetical protein